MYFDKFKLFRMLDPVLCGDGGGSAVVGLADLNVYWTIVFDANTINLALTEADANAGTAIDITADGAGASRSLTLRRMMLDSNASGAEKRFLKNIAFDIANTSGLNAWNSTSQGGGGGGTARVTVEQVEIKNGHHTAYAVEADSQIAESGMLTGLVLT